MVVGVLSFFYLREDSPASGRLGTSEALSAASAPRAGAIVYCRSLVRMSRGLAPAKLLPALAAASVVPSPANISAAAPELGPPQRNTSQHGHRSLDAAKLHPQEWILRRRITVLVVSAVGRGHTTDTRRSALAVNNVHRMLELTWAAARLAWAWGGQLQRGARCRRRHHTLGFRGLMEPPRHRRWGLL